MAPPVRSLLDLSGKRALITGAGSGLGAAIARRFAEAGAHVAVHYATSITGANAVVADIVKAGGIAVALQADLTDANAVRRLFEGVDAALGGMDVLINNAGIYPLHDIAGMPVAAWDNMLAANLRSAFLCTQAAAQRMTGGGAIVNITSIEAENPAPLHAHYSAAKAGLAMLTRSSAAELGVRGIRVNAVAPGLIWREGIEQAWPEGVARYCAAAPLGRLGQPEDVADACLFLASAGARWITGAQLTVDGGVLTAQAY
jgi:NAD(P)-dependent dehydrogenase (short-subunit alcohol dehydrogenase family)